MIAARLSFAAALFCAAVATTAVSTAAVAEMAPGDVKIVDGEIAQSLTGAPGNAADGRKAFVDRKLGNCLACHANSEASEQQFHGEVGPTLDGAGERWTVEQLRAILVDSKEVFGPQTVMPGFYSLNVGVDVRKDLVGKTILTAEEIEAIVAYLVTLK